MVDSQSLALLCEYYFYEICVLPPARLELVAEIKVNHFFLFWFLGLVAKQVCIFSITHQECATFSSSLTHCYHRYLFPFSPSSNLRRLRPPLPPRHASTSFPFSSSFSIRPTSQIFQCHHVLDLFHHMSFQVSQLSLVQFLEFHLNLQ